MGYVYRFLRESIIQRPVVKEEDSSSNGLPLVSATDDYGSLPEKGNSNRELGLTDEYVDWSHSKNSILKVHLALLIYIGVAIVGYSFVFENWSIIDSIYFAITVFTTVGYGDLSPSNTESRIFTMIFGLTGVIILGVYLGIIGSRVFELQEAQIEKRSQNIRLKVLEQFSSDDTSRPPPDAARLIVMDIISIITKLSPMMLVLFLIACPVVYLEGGWNIMTGLYWMFITGTTIGFGDLSPTTTWTKIISIIYLPLATAVFGELLSHIAGAYMGRCNDQAENKLMARALTVGDLKKMDFGEDGVVKPHEFLSYMLITMKKCEEEDVDEILTLFNKLDKDGNGVLDKSDLSNKYRFSIRPGVVATANM